MPSDTTFGHIKIFDDFVGDTFDTFLWTVNVDAGCTGDVSEAHNGMFRFTMDGTNGDIGNIFGAESWRAGAAGAGPLIMEARVRTSSLSTGLYIGWTDDNDTDEIPINLDTGTLTTTASDAVGFTYDSQEDAHLYMTSVKADVDGAQTAVDGRFDPVASTFLTLKVVLNVDGDALFFVNGKQVGSREACVTTTVNLAPCVATLTSGTATNVDVDYIYVCAPRA